MTDRRVPLHLAVLLGTSAAAYAVSLAGVTALQSATDQAIADERAPVQDAAARAAAQHDRLASEVERSAAAYAAMAARYDAIAADLADLDASLQGQATLVKKVSGAARALPKQVALPTVSHTTVTVTVSRPRVSASTGASGG
jgi:hypothetical protein